MPSGMNGSMRVAHRAAMRLVPFGEPVLAKAGNARARKKDTLPSRGWQGDLVFCAGDTPGGCQGQDERKRGRVAASRRPAPARVSGL